MVPIRDAHKDFSAARLYAKPSRQAGDTAAALVLCLLLQIPTWPILFSVCSKSI